MPRPLTSATSILFCTAAARLAARLDTVSLRRSGTYVLETLMHRGNRVVMTIPGSSFADTPIALDIIDQRGGLGSFDLDTSAVRLFYAVMTLGRARNIAKKAHGAPLLHGALTALARWHDVRVESTMRILSFRVASIAHEITNAEITSADRAAGSPSTTAVSSSG